MPPLDGLERAMEEAPFWTAVVTAIGAALTALGARNAGERFTKWAQRRMPPGNGGEIVQELRAIKSAVHAEGRKTQEAVVDEGEKTRETITEWRINAAESRVSRQKGAG